MIYTSDPRIGMKRCRDVACPKVENIEKGKSRVTKNCLHVNKRINL